MTDKEIERLVFAKYPYRWQAVNRMAERTSLQLKEKARWQFMLNFLEERG